MRNLREYLWAGSPAEALRMLASHAGRGAFLGGGTALVARQDPGLDFVVDLSRAGLGGLAGGDGGLEIGAGVPLQSIADERGVRSLAFGLLAEAARRTRTEPWRRQATIAGRILEEDPTDLVTPSLLVLEARLRLLRDPDGEPELVGIDAATGGSLPGFRPPDRPGAGRGPGPPAVALVLSVVIPSPEPGWGFALESVSRAALDAPLAAVAVGVRMRGSTIETARVATSALPSPRRAPRAEATLRGVSLDSMGAALAALEQDVAPRDDWRASAEYRLHAARVLLGRAVRRAAANAAAAAGR